jgi:hypothetical protein
MKTLGQREAGRTERLNQSVAAYRDALKVRTRKWMPIDWALTQMNLAVVLTTLAEREEGTLGLDEAIKACRAALEIFDRARATHHAASASQNLQRAEGILRQRFKKEHWGQAINGKHKRRSVSISASCRFDYMENAAKRQCHKDFSRTAEVAVAAMSDTETRGSEARH